MGSISPYGIQSNTSVVGKVVTQQGQVVPHATAVIYPASPFKMYETDLNGEFEADYSYVDPQAQHDYTVTVKVSKKGYHDAYRLVSMSAKNGKLIKLIFTLRNPQGDPQLLSQGDFIKAMSPELRELSLLDGLPSREAKDYSRGVTEFLDRNRYDQAVPLLVKVVHASPNWSRCRTMLALAELAWGDWDDAETEISDTVSSIIQDKRQLQAEPLVAEGVLLSWQHQPDKAGDFFVNALKYDPHNALALQELGRAQGQMFDWESANATLAKALEAGAGPEARFLHAEALLWAGTAPQARNELNQYLNGRDIKAFPPRVRELSDRITEREKDSKAFEVASAKMKKRGEEPLDYLKQSPKGLEGFEPAADQSLLDPILTSVGHRVAELYTNFPNTISVEVIHQEMLSKNGKVGLTHEQKFNYLCMIPAMPWGPTTDEYRADSRGNLAMPSGVEQNLMLTSGFVAAPLVFHPVYQEGSAFHYWGRQNVNGSPAYVVAFAQQPARSRIYGSFQIGNVSKQTYFQGLAWVDTSTYQIVRLTTDLLTPIPKVKLNRETTDIEFNKVQFSQVKQIFWLPRQVTVTLDWDGHTLRNSHQYSDFHVFKVDQKQQIGSPQADSTSRPECHE